MSSSFNRKYEIAVIGNNMVNSSVNDADMQVLDTAEPSGDFTSHDNSCNCIRDSVWMADIAWTKPNTIFQPAPVKQTLQLDVSWKFQDWDVWNRKHCYL